MSVVTCPVCGGSGKKEYPRRRRPAGMEYLPPQVFTCLVCEGLGLVMQRTVEEEAVAGATATTGNEPARTEETGDPHEHEPQRHDPATRR